MEIILREAEMTKIAVYCGANEGFGEEYVAQARKLGEWLVQKNYDLVFGGGKIGLMGVVADTVLAGGGKAYGVMPQFLVDQEQAHDGLTKLTIVNDMDERKQAMLTQADVCIALPGGPGTMEEFTQAYSLLRVGQSTNPCVLFDYAGYYSNFVAQYDLMVEQGFLSVADRKKLFCSDSLEEIDEYVTDQLLIPPVFDFKDVKVKK